MPEFEARWPCPVCLGVNLEKVSIGETLVLDHCPRCGGVWFDAGEVERLPTCDPRAFWAVIEHRAEVARAMCHHCQALMPRDLDRCPACGKEQVFACPTCQEPMKKVLAGEVRLDRCSRCQGIWFDHHELAGVWERAVAKVVTPHPGGDPSVLPAVGGAVLEVVAYNPGLALYGVEAAGRLVAGAVDVLVNVAPGVLASAAEMAGDVAAAAFEAIVEIIGGLTS